MCLNIKELYCRGRDGFCRVDDLKSRRIFTHMNKLLSVRPKFSSKSIIKEIFNKTTVQIKY